MALIIGRDFCEGHLIPHLVPADLASLQATDRTTRGVLSTSRPWQICVSMTTPKFRITPECFVAKKRPSFLKQWRALCSPGLAENLTVEIPSLQEAEQLAGIARGAQRAADARAAGGGGATHVVFAQLRFPEEHLEKALGGGDAEFRGACVGAPIRTRIDGKLARALKMPLATMIAIRFGWQEGRLLAKIQEDHSARDMQATEEAPEELAATANARCGVLVVVRARHPALTLQCRGVARTGDRWSLLREGLTSFKGGKASAAGALSEGVLCAICLRVDRLDAIEEVMRPTGLAHAMHFDQLGPVAAV